jgi:hypothetical protein
MEGIGRMSTARKLENSPTQRAAVKLSPSLPFCQLQQTQFCPVEIEGSLCPLAGLLRPGQVTVAVFGQETVQVYCLYSTVRTDNDRNGCSKAAAKTLGMPKSWLLRSNIALFTMAATGTPMTNTYALPNNAPLRSHAPCKQVKRSMHGRVVPDLLFVVFFFFFYIFIYDGAAHWNSTGNLCACGHNAQLTS